MTPRPSANHTPRTQLLRRKLNDQFYGFGDPDGNFSWSKFVAVWGQIAVLFQFGRNFDMLLDKPETMLIMLAFVISPEILKKFLALRYGGSAK